ncbi:MAG: Mur ligase family protein [Methanobacteriaceae archaeon]|nr:Mur ligase family protein [Methanobacteriaceae archaeon]
MLVSVIGLGVEGQKAVKSLMEHNYDIYASDFNKNINLELISNLPKTKNKLEIETGSHNLDKILDSNMVAVSPSLFNKSISKQVIENGNFISNILTKHKTIPTIAVTGTNGKTTTSRMIHYILKENGYNVLIGGNGGGGFEGYYDLLLKANEDKNYDYLIVEVCDMTLDFCKYVFDIDICVVTNIGYDHMDIHRSIKEYTNEVANFIENKTAILNSEDENTKNLEDTPSELLLFKKYKHHLNLFGSFNESNAAAASTVCKYLNIPEKNIIKSLSTFRPVKGRIRRFSIKRSNIVIGKTDNRDAIEAVLSEEYFETALIGTARKNETYRYQILDSVKKHDPETVVLFPGLDDITQEYKDYLDNLGYANDLFIIKDKEYLINFIKNHITQNKNIFIGGNGQEKITEINQILIDQYKEDIK